ncbi:hypothetical protein BH18ACT4_BH18ACT4_01390 [soil metagenome]
MNRGATSVAEAPPVQLNLLHGFELSVSGRCPVVPLGTQRLLAFVALQPRPVHRCYVAGTLWPDKPEERASANLRSALWRLNGPKTPLVDASSTHVALAPAVVVDLQESESVARQVVNGDMVDVVVARAALLRGDLLPDWYDDWLLLARERHRQLRLHALEGLSIYHCAAGRFAQAIETGLEAVAAEPLRESAHRCVIEAHLAEGNRCEALRQFRGYQRLMHEQLDDEPSAQLAALVGR